MNTARERLDGNTQGLLGQVWNQRTDGADGAVALVERITAARRGVSQRFHDGQELRPLLYLDLALEQLVRGVVERHLHQHLNGAQLADLIGWVLENVTLSQPETELGACLCHWRRLSTAPAELRGTPGWSLHAKSVVGRIGRALGDWTDRLYQVLQPKAEFFGQAIHAEAWSITLFSEEVVRGSSLGFALSMLLHQVGRVLRQSANLGDWQIVSRGRASGRVEVVETLRTVQGKQLQTPTVVIAEKVMGDEELPKEVVAVIAPDVTDLVSHVAVRARNAQMLFASCSDPSVLEHLKSLRGRFLHLEVTAAGDVVFHEITQAEPQIAGAPGGKPRRSGARPRFTRFAISLDEFNDRVVGAKSCSQARLRGKLPDGVRQPGSVALPFGCFEQVLAYGENRKTAERYGELADRLRSGLKAQPKRGVRARGPKELTDSDHGSVLGPLSGRLSDPAQSENANLETLVTLRELIESLIAPEELKLALREKLSKAEMAWPEDWESSWRCIKQVWASKWNERAVLSRQKLGMDDGDLFMAVLIQPVVEADYAFVLHTVNPSTNNRDELYGELVLGLGETLVGNFPGRALSFVWDKRTEQSRLTSFPSKSVGLYGGGLIFRSDSNGEDLEGYAGAGLYDSVLHPPPRQVELDYSDEPLLWDEAFRRGLLAEIGWLGLAIEKALSSAQDIEGAVAKGGYFVVQTRPQVGLDHP